MNKAETLEIKKQFTPDRCTIDHICGCYVDHEKNKRLTFRKAFGQIPEKPGGTSPTCRCSNMPHQRPILAGNRLPAARLSHGWLSISALPYRSLSLISTWFSAPESTGYSFTELAIRRWMILGLAGSSMHQWTSRPQTLFGETPLSSLNIWRGARVFCNGVNLTMTSLSTFRSMTCGSGAKKGCWWCLR